MSKNSVSLTVVTRSEVKTKESLKSKN